jgi:hypothetical protein
MFAKLNKFVKGLEKAKALWAWKETKLKTKLIFLNCALSSCGCLEAEAHDDVELNRLLDLEERIKGLQSKLKMYLELSN